MLAILFMLYNGRNLFIEEFTLTLMPCPTLLKHWWYCTCLKNKVLDANICFPNQHPISSKATRFLFEFKMHFWEGMMVFIVITLEHSLYIFYKCAIEPIVWIL